MPPVLFVLIFSLLGIANAATVESPNRIQCDEDSLTSLHCLMHNDLVVILSVVGLLVLPPLAMASFLCCNTEEKTDQSLNRRLSRKERRLSRKERKSLASSKDVSINITDIDNPLGSDHFTTFHKIVDDDDKSTGHLVNTTSQSLPSLIDERPSINNTDNVLESSLDIGIRPESYYAPSLSSMISLGPRVPPEGSSLLSLSAIEKSTSPLTIPSLTMPPPPSIPPPPSSHLRQHSTPISSQPSPSHILSPLKSRPLTIIGHPSQDQSSGTPAKPDHTTTPILSPVSLTESEALVPSRTGRVQPYRVVHQPSPSLTSLTNLPHSSDGVSCTHCGAKLTNDPELLHLVEPASEHPPANNDELCHQCQVNDPHYHELDLSDDDTVCSPPPATLQSNVSTEIDPLYERIGSIRRQHMTSITTTSHASSDDVSDVAFHPKPPALPSAFTLPSTRGINKDNKTRSLPAEERDHLSKCQLPSEGAPLPPRPPTLGLMMDESIVEHNYESLPSTFGIESPHETVYARISSPEEEPDTPPYVPDNSERAQMLKIDSQGYAEVVHGEENDEMSNLDTECNYSPLDHPQFSNRQAMASDYEVPVRIAPPSPSLPHHSPTHTKPSPIPVPTPIPPTSSSSLNVAAQPPAVPLPSEHKTTVAPHLRRQQAIAENPLPLPVRSSQQPTRSLRILPQSDSQQDTRRDSSDSTASYHLTFRFSTASSGLGESMTESLRAISEEELEKDRETNESRSSMNTEPTVIKQKIYEVENRSRTKSYPNRGYSKSPVQGGLRNKAQTMNPKNVISFNEDSQTV